MKYSLLLLSLGEKSKENNYYLNDESKPNLIQISYRKNGFTKYSKAKSGRFSTGGSRLKYGELKLLGEVLINFTDRISLTN